MRDELRKRRVAIAIVLIAGALVLVALDVQVESRFQGRLFHLPGAVYSRSLVLERGVDIDRVGLRDHLRRLGYRRVSGSRVARGEYAVGRREIRIGRRPFRYPDRAEPGGLLLVRHDRSGEIESLRDERGARLRSAVLEPERLGSFYAESWEERRLVQLSDVPAHLITALLTIEDQHFFEHWGLDVRRIGGAALANARERRVAQGGSTLTQQLVKNFYLSADRTLVRKAREAVMALLLEARHTKEEILEAYLNEIYLGQRGPVAIHGIGAAARHYFGKDPQDLDLAESALLVGLIRSPGSYSPQRDPEVALARRNFVLDILLEKERISDERFHRARRAPLGAVPPHADDRPALYFLAHVRQELELRHGARTLERDGYSIFTTLDPHRQRLAQRAVARGIRNLEQRFPELVREESPLQAALVALDPRSGELLAMVGGRDFQKSQFNRAVQALRQPGSAFKPVVALAALERNGRGEDEPPYTLASIIEDEPLIVPSWDGDEEKEWAPENYSGEYEGQVTLREAIERSLNVPMARLGMSIGFDRIVDVARRLGIESRLARVPSLALGASEVTLLELTRAYAVMAAQGRRPEIGAIRAVVDEEGKVLEAWEPTSVAAFEPQEIYLVTSALHGVVERGTGRSLRALGYRGPVAGKTGTTNEYRDAWFLGYTPELVVGVWVGFDDNESIGVEGAVAALPIFADFLIGAVGSRGQGEFDRPTGIERIRVNADRGLRAGWGCRGKPELFAAGTAPSEFCGRQELYPWDTTPLEWISDLLLRGTRAEVEPPREERIH